QMDEICASVILSGVCERHPKLTLVLGESGIGWLPYMLERLDDTYEERLADDLGLKLPPSAYFKRQMYATFQKDFHGVRAMAEIAPDNVMWGSDYPHRAGTWPFSQKAIEGHFRVIPAAIQSKMLWENVRRVYGIDKGQAAARRRPRPSSTRCESDAGGPAPARDQGLLPQHLRRRDHLVPHAGLLRPLGLARSLSSRIPARHPLARGRRRDRRSGGGRARPRLRRPDDRRPGRAPRHRGEPSPATAPATPAG